MQKVYLFTLSFPFGYGETFLENEMKVASQIPALRVVLVPFFLGKQPRDLPEGICLDTSLAKLINQYHEKKVYPLLAHLPDIIRGIFEHECKQPSAIRDVAGMVHHGKLVRKWASEKLKSGDITYTYWFDRITYGLSKLISERQIDFRLVSRVHRYDIYAEERKHGFIPYNEYMLNMVNQVFAISEHGREYLIKKFSGSVRNIAEKVVVSRLGVADRGVNILAVNERVIRIVSCSNVIKVKRVEEIAKLIIEYAATNPDRHIVWDHFGDGPLRGSVATMVQQIPLNLEVVLHGQVSNASVIEFYESNPVNAFINLSDSEGIPVSIMEAQSFGIPVLARDVGGVGEIVNNTNGHLLGANYEMEKAVEALAEIINNKEKRKKSRDLFLENYLADQNYKEFYQALTRRK